MRPLIKSLLLSSTFVGLGLGGIVTASASNYSARRANSVRLVWRHHMGRHAYHTVKGARYSKHLGVKYSTNDDLPDVTWYTDAHEKLYNKKKHTAAIYYHVKSGDGQHGGWIWRGYLTAGTVIPNTEESSGNKETDSDESLASQMIQNLGHGAHSDPQTMDKAKEVLKRSLNGRYSFLTQHELRPTSTYTFDKDYVVVRNFNADAITHNSADKNEVIFYNLLSDSNVAMVNEGFRSGYYVQDREHTIDLLSANYAPYPEFFGQKGLTSANYFLPVKIGAAVTKVGNGKYAAFVMLYYPQKYWDLRVDD